MMCKNVFMKSLYMYAYAPLSQYTKALIYNCVLQNWYSTFLLRHNKKTKNPTLNRHVNEKLISLKSYYRFQSKTVSHFT